MCLVKETLKKAASKATCEITDMDFNIFTSLTTEEIGYNPEKHIICYRRLVLRDIIVDPERK